MSDPEPVNENGPTKDMAVREVALSRKEIIWLGITALGLLAVYLSPLGQHLTHIQDVRAELAATGRLAPLVFIIAMTGLTAIGIPRMLMYPIAGIAFGFGWGLAWSLLATVSGAYLTFGYARWAGRSLILKKWPNAGALSQSLRDRSFLTVALLRQLPGPGFLFNLVFGISAVRHRAFLAGTLLGAMPSAIPATLIGTSISLESNAARLFSLAASILCLLAVWTVFSLYITRSARFQEIRKAWSRRRQPDPEVEIAATPP